MKNRIIFELVVFVFTFVLVYLIYSIVNKQKKGKKKKVPVEVTLLENYFKVDISKLDYNKLIRQISLISSLDVSIIISISCFSNIGFVRIILALVMILPVIFLSYLLFSKYCNKKIQNERGKRKWVILLK